MDDGYRTGDTHEASMEPGPLMYPLDAESKPSLSKPSLSNRAGAAAAIVLMLCAAAIVIALTVRICVVIWP